MEALLRQWDNQSVILDSRSVRLPSVGCLMTGKPSMSKRQCDFWIAVNHTMALMDRGQIKSRTVEARTVWFLLSLWLQDTARTRTEGGSLSGCSLGSRSMMKSKQRSQSRKTTEPVLIPKTPRIPTLPWALSMGESTSQEIHVTASGAERVSM